jgi:two-component system NtrC family response regulator
MVLGKSDLLGIESFPTQLAGMHAQPDSVLALIDDLKLPDDGISLIDTVEHIERELIKEALKRTGGNKTRAADLLGVTRKIMRYKTEKYGLESTEEESNTS